MNRLVFSCLGLFTAFLGLMSGACQLPTPGPAAAWQGSAESRSERAFQRLQDIQPVPRFAAATADVESRGIHESAARHLATGRRHFDHQQWTQAIESFDKALQADPQAVDVRLLLARAAMRQGNNALAETHLQEVLRLSPRETAAHQMLGELAWQDGHAAMAIASLRLALLSSEAAPNRPERVLAHLTLAMALRKEGYLSAAVEQLEQYETLTANPTPEMTNHRELSEVIVLYRGKAHGLIGEIRTQLGQHELAARAYEQAIQQSPEDAALRGRFAEALARAGRADDAMAQARKLIVESPDGAEGIELLQQVCNLLGKPDRFKDELPRIADSVTRPALRMRIAEMLLTGSNTEQALAILRKLAEDDPSDMKARCLLTRLLLERGQHEEAIRQIESQLRDQPDVYATVEQILASVSPLIQSAMMHLAQDHAQRPDVDGRSHYLYGFLLRLAGRREEARQQFEFAATAQPAFAPAQIAVSREDFEHRRFENALATLEQVEKNVTQDAALHLLKGRCHLALSELDKAEHSLLESFRLESQSAEPLFLLAESYERRGDLKRVEQLYRRILDDVDPRHVPARERLVRLYMNAEKLDRAKEYFSDFERLGLTGAPVDRCAAMIQLATSRKVSGTERLEEYRGALRAIAEKYPQDPATRIDLSMTYVTMGDIESALSEAQTAVTVAPNDLRARELLATLHGRLLDFDKAGEILKSLLLDRPRDFSYQQKLLELAVNQADWPTVVESLRTLIARPDLEAMRDRFTRQLVETLVLAERYDEAINTAKSWLDDSPADENRQDTVLTALQAAKRKNEAVVLAAKWLAEEPSNTESRVRYINQLTHADRLAEAQHHVLSWLSHSADDLALNRMLLSLFWRAKDWDSAMELARIGAELSENRIHYQNALGLTYRLAKRHDDAVAFYRTRIKSSPSEAAFDDLIMALVSAERYDEAEATIHSILGPQLARKEAGETFDPMGVIRLRRHLANLYQLTDRMPAAIEQLERVYELTPSDPGINNDLGYTYLEAGVNLDKADKMIRLALGERPRESAYLDSHGWVLYKRGRFKDAIVFIDRAIRLGDSDDPVLFDHLADALYREGRREEAKINWEKTLTTLDKRGESLETLQDRKLRNDVTAKLKQCAENQPVDVAALAPTNSSNPQTTSPSDPPTRR